MKRFLKIDDPVAHAQSMVRDIFEMELEHSRVRKKFFTNELLTVHMPSLNTTIYTLVAPIVPSAKGNTVLSPFIVRSS